MSKIVFFNIPAYGHTNPTIEVVRELTTRGHSVWYYSFEPFKKKIESAGGTFISCDAYLPHLRPEDEWKVGKDFSALIDMIVETTLALDEKVCQELKALKPDLIVYDSVCFYGKLFAKKLNIPVICSTTTFAFNQHSAKMMKPSLGEMVSMLVGMRQMNQQLGRLRQSGYDIENLISLIQNDDQTDTLVYTSKEFQPMSETFSDRVVFIGPSVSNEGVSQKIRKRPKIYISLGTINNQELKFYQNCIKAFKELELDVIMSVGEKINFKDLGDIPKNFEVAKQVNQIQVLQQVDAFISHSGMNSVNESLYYGVPLILYPRQSEQKMVAHRVEQLEAGKQIKRNHPKVIKEVTLKVIREPRYKEKVNQLSRSFHESGGPKTAVDFILTVSHKVNETTH